MRLKIRFTKWSIDNTVIIQKSTFKRNTIFSMSIASVLFHFCSQLSMDKSKQFSVTPPKKQNSTWNLTIPHLKKGKSCSKPAFLCCMSLSVYYRRSSSSNPQPNPPPMQRSDHLLRNEAQWQFFLFLEGDEVDIV